MLVKITAWGTTLEASADRLHRALREFRIRGVKSNIPFLLNLLKNKDFRESNTTVHFIADHPELLSPPRWRDRGTKLLTYLADVIVNGNEDVKKHDADLSFVEAKVPRSGRRQGYKDGTKQRLSHLGPEAFSKWLREEKSIQFSAIRHQLSRSSYPMPDYH